MAGRRTHRRAIGNEDVRCVMDLVERIDDGLFGIRPHPRAAHLMNGGTARIGFGRTHDHGATSCLQHSPSFGFGVLEGRQFILAVAEADLDLGQAEGIGLVLVELNAIFRIGKAFGERSEK